MLKSWNGTNDDLSENRPDAVSRARSRASRSTRPDPNAVGSRPCTCAVSESLASAPGNESVVPLPTYVSRFAGSPTQAIAALGAVAGDARGGEAEHRVEGEPGVREALAVEGGLQVVAVHELAGQPAGGGRGRVVGGRCGGLGGGRDDGEHRQQREQRGRGGGEDTPRRSGDGQGHQGPPFGTGSARRAEGSRDREPGRSQLDDRRRPGHRPADLDGIGG